MNGIEVEGLDEVIENLNRKLGTIKGYSRETMHAVCLDLKGKAQRIAPKYKGPLRGSASYQTKENKSGITGTVGFYEPYALIQHENLYFHHDEGQSKYLEQPLYENTNDYFEAFKKSAGDALNE